MKLKVEMTLTGETAQKLKETGERLAAMDLGDDGMLAAVVLMRIAANYERERQEKAGVAIPVEQLIAENDE
jgi:hypothetical protein